MDYAEHLKGCFKKVDRADELLGTLNDEWGAFLDTNPYPSWVQEHPDSGWNHVYIDFSAPIDLRLSVLAGEIAHELRTTLDHVMWAFAYQYLEREPTDKEARDITFPLALDEHAFDNSKALRYVSENTRAFLKEFQPYKAPNDPKDHALCLLHWFNRIDKHRTLHAAAVYTDPHSYEPLLHWNPEFEVRDKLILVVPREEAKAQAEIARLRFDPWNPFSGPQPNVSVKGELPMNVEFGDPDPKRQGGDLAFMAKAVRGLTALAGQQLAVPTMLHDEPSGSSSSP